MTVLDPTGVLDITDYDAVVLGSAVYAGHWLAPAREVARVLSYAEPSPETWLFSSGPVGDPPKPDEEPVDVSEVMETTGARDHRVFAGKIDKSKLSFPERALVAAVGAKEGDYRDWDEIESWAEAIADSLEEAVVMSLTIDYQ